MAFQKLVWVGLACCLVALAIQVFPQAAFHAGADARASWLVFVFGIFLIAIAAITIRSSGPRERD